MLTKQYLYAKIGIVKVIFIIFEKSFQIFEFNVKNIFKNENNFQNSRKEAEFFEQDFTAGAAHVQRYG